MDRLRVVLVVSFLFFMLCANAQSNSLLNTSYTPAVTNGTVIILLEDIQKRTGIEVSYSADVLQLDNVVSLSGAETSIGDALRSILKGQQVTAVESNGRILIIPMLTQRKHTIHGYVKDASSKEALIGAVVYVPALQAGIITNSYGYFSLTIPAGTYSVLCTYVGYRPETHVIEFSDDIRQDVLLMPGSDLGEVKISATEAGQWSGEAIKLLGSQIEDKPALLETDVLRSMQRIAGVQPGVEGTNDLVVRGGDPGQNLYLLDNVPLYYIDHLMGLTSLYNPGALKSVEFHKGAFPSRFGERLSSIIDVHTKDGNMERIGGQFEMGLVKSSLNLEGPIIKDKASAFISLRRTWLDLLSPSFIMDMKLNFYDVNAKANFILNKNNRLYLSFYNGKDKLVLFPNDLNSISTALGNTITSLKWNAVIGPRLFINTIGTFSLFRYSLNDISQNIVILPGDSSYYNGNSSIKENSLRVQAHWYAGTRHKVESGIQYSRAGFVPVDIRRISAAPNSPVGTSFQSNEAVLYMEDEWRLTDRFKIRAGLHWANWFNEEYDYSILQPRVNTAYRVSDDHTLTASFSRMGQFLHFVNNNTYGLPTEFWVPSTRRIRPESAWQGTLGYTGLLKELAYNLELYYKHVDGVITYNVGRTLIESGDKWESRVVQGKGWSYGAELSLNRSFGPFTASANYTLSWTWRKFASLNKGVAFPYRYDRRHNIQLGLTYRSRSGKVDAQANWTFMSGEALTFPDQVMADLDETLHINDPEVPFTKHTYNYVEWSGYRLPPIHRLDLRVNYHIKKGGSKEHIFSAGVFNAYGRPNVMFVRLEGNDPTEFRLRGVSYFRALPYLSYKFTF